MNWKQFLTEKVLGECWNIYVNFNDEGMCQKCGDPAEKHAGNRTFDNRSDLMDLYQKIYEDGKWSEYDGEDYAVLRWIDCEPARHEKDADYDAWLFCLDGEAYEDRCKMVSEFYGWGEEKNNVSN